MKTRLLIISAASVLMLQACGGGGGDNSSNPLPSNTTTPPGNTATPPTGGNGADQGSVSASFVPSNTSRYILLNPLGQTSGALTSNQQAADGAITALNSNQLSGTYAIQDIAGDASFAIGRWVQGTVTTSTGADTLTGTDGRAYHYIAYQALSAFPSNSLHCVGGSFTTPTYTSGGSKAALTGAATGTADISFSGGQGALTGSVTVNANGETATQALPSTLSSPSSMSLTGLGTNIPYTGAQLADAGNGAYALAVQFAAVTPSGARYIGVGRLSCTSN
ncbi:MAG: hypothetical protein LBH31_07980 [Burkholderiaceae bacterium]|jgi:hypothetical protein|nr:hypothetical protein [Burkholderiaceae bacterium]